MAEQLRHGRESRSIRSICLRLHQDLYQELQGENNGPVVRHDALQLQPSDVMVFFYGFCGVLWIYLTLSWYSKFVL